MTHQQISKNIRNVSFDLAFMHDDELDALIRDLSGVARQIRARYDSEADTIHLKIIEATIELAQHYHKSFQET